MIKNINNINNQKLKIEYNKMLSEMYEHVYKFKPGIKLGFKTEKKSLIDYKTFNFFSMYNKYIHILHKEINQSIKEFCLNNNINFEKNYFYLLGNIIKNDKLPLNTFINFAPNYKITFTGFYVIDCNDDTIFIEDKEIKMEPGQLFILKSEDRIMFKKISNEFTVLSFNISPLEYLYRQYYQKWIPLS